MAEYTYRRILSEAEHRAIYERVVAEGLMGTFNAPAVPTIEAWLWTAMRPDVLTLAGYIDGELGGFLVGLAFTPMGTTRCMEISVCAFRDHFQHAEALSRGAYIWCFDNLDCISLVGRVIVSNRHVLRMAPRVGFERLGRVPGMFWSERKKRFMDGWILLATRASVQAAIDNKGGNA